MFAIPFMILHISLVSLPRILSIFSYMVLRKTLHNMHSYARFDGPV